MNKYANRDWPWCDPRLEEYMDKYNAMHKSNPEWPKPNGETKEKWHEKIVALMDKHWSAVNIELEKLKEEYKDIIELVNAAGNPYDKQ